MSLCRHCLDREGIKSRAKIEPQLCDLCKGVLSNLEQLGNDIIRKLSEYEFDTFLVGASVPQVLLDKEDELRSKLKIKGKESIKSQITRILSRNVSSSTGKKVEFSRPDLTILVSIADSSMTFNPRSIWLRAKYRKLTRGIPQKDNICRTCNGLGCADCGYQGKQHRSVQSIITKFLVEKFQADACNFVWLGSEDANSLVHGSGRPFYVEVAKPKRRSYPTKGRKKLRKKVAFGSNEIEVIDLERLMARVTDVPQFDVLCRVNLVKKVSGLDTVFPILKVQEQFTNALVNVRLSRKSRIVQRLVRSISLLTGEDSQNVQLLIKCEGGIPLKKLISGQNNDVEPNLAVLTAAYQIDPAQPFDILDVMERKDRKRYGSNDVTVIETLETELIPE